MSALTLSDFRKDVQKQKSTVASWINSENVLDMFSCFDRSLECDGCAYYRAV